MHSAEREIPRRTPSRHASDNAKRSAGRGEKTVRWTVFSRGDPRRGAPRQGASGTLQPGKGCGENPAGVCLALPSFAEQGETNKKAVFISNAAQKYTVSLPVSPPAPSPSRRERGFHPVTRPFTLRRTARPLPSRGGVCSQRHTAKSKLGSALSVRCLSFYDSLRLYNACREQSIKMLDKAEAALQRRIPPKKRLSKLGVDKPG